VKNFEELVDETARAIQRTDATFRPILEDAIRRRYRQVLRVIGWVEKTSRMSIVTTASTSLIAVPEIARDIVSVYNATTNEKVEPRGVEQLDRDYDDNVSSATTGHVYSRERVSPWNGVSFGTANNFFGVFSTAAGDSLAVKVKLLNDEGHVFEATGTVNGATLTTITTLPVASLIQDVISFTKIGDSAGTIKLAHGTTGNVVSSIGPLSRTARYTWLRLSSAAALGTTFQIRYRKGMQDIDSPIEVPQVDCGDILVVGALADGLRSMNASQRSLIEEGRFGQMLDDFMNEYELEGEEYRQASGSVDEYRVM